MTLSTMVDAALTIERLRVASEVRQSHLTRQGKQDPETDELHRRLKDLEDYRAYCCCGWWLTGLALEETS